jgi:hypothetical protein
MDVARLNIRLPRRLHAQLAGAAAEEGVSLNTLMVALLAGGVGFTLDNAGPARPRPPGPWPNQEAPEMDEQGRTDENPSVWLNSTQFNLLREAVELDPDGLVGVELTKVALAPSAPTIRSHVVVTLTYKGGRTKMLRLGPRGGLYTMPVPAAER